MQFCISYSQAALVKDQFRMSTLGLELGYEFLEQASVRSVFLF